MFVASNLIVLVWEIFIKVSYNVFIWFSYLLENHSNSAPFYNFEGTSSCFASGIELDFNKFWVDFFVVDSLLGCNYLWLCWLKLVVTKFRIHRHYFDWSWTWWTFNYNFSRSVMLIFFQKEKKWLCLQFGNLKLINHLIKEILCIKGKHRVASLSTTRILFFFF